MMRVPVFLGGLFFWLNGLGQPAHISEDNISLTAGSYSLHFTDAFSFTNNPACLGSFPVFSAGLATERKWMMKELDNTQLACSFQAGNGGAGIALMYSGDADYNEQSVELAYGKNLGRTEMGLCFGYLHDQTSGYPAIGYGSVGVAIRIHVSEKWITGWEMSLPVFGKAGKTDVERGSQIFRMGFGYESGTDLFLSMQVEKTSGLPINLVPGIAYRYNDQLFFSFGIITMSGSPSFKAGWKKNRLCIQWCISYQPVLGFSPGLVLLWEGKNQKR
jgi:hypothetical protein